MLPFTKCIRHYIQKIILKFIKIPEVNYNLFNVIARIFEDINETVNVLRVKFFLQIYITKINTSILLFNVQKSRDIQPALHELEAAPDIGNINYSYKFKP